MPRCGSQILFAGSTSLSISPHVLVFRCEVDLFIGFAHRLEDGGGALRRMRPRAHARVGSHALLPEGLACFTTNHSSCPGLASCRLRRRRVACGCRSAGCCCRCCRCCNNPLTAPIAAAPIAAPAAALAATLRPAPIVKEARVAAAPSPLGVAPAHGPIGGDRTSNGP